MKFLVLSLFVGVATALVAQPAKPSAPALAHVRSTFSFTVNAPQKIVAPLFGAHLERAWAEGWDPQFVYPLPAEDKPGEIFTVNHGGHVSTWVNTALDLEKGHIQFTYVVPQATAVLIDIQVTASGPSTSRVEISYERTALSAEVNDHVHQQGEQDAKSGPHWQKAIENYLKKEGKLR
jgi:hypothetical protein